MQTAPAMPQTAAEATAPAHVIVPHRSSRRSGGRPLAPWVVHVLQGLPTVAADATVAVAAPSDLPFALSTKEALEAHDLSALSAAQSALVANEYGKVEQAREISAALASLCCPIGTSTSSASLPTRPVVERVECHQVTAVSVHALVRVLQLEQQTYDRRRLALAPDSAERLTVPNVLVLNLCDGTEADSYPGVTVARALEATTLPRSAGDADVDLPALRYTGADSAFFGTTTDKVTMKRLFSLAGEPVRSSRFVDLSAVSSDEVCSISISNGGVHASLALELAPLAFPLIIKPTSSYSSCGLTSRSVVHSIEEALRQAQTIRRELGDVLAEEFVQGREFSMLVVGDWDGDGRMVLGSAASSTAAATSSAASVTPIASPSSYSHLRCYTAAERAFSSSLPVLERFLTFEQNYPTDHTKVETWWQPLFPMDATVPSTNAADSGTLVASGAAAASAAQEAMALLAARAYTACLGRSYGRVDLRQCAATGEYFVLEVNSLPGLSSELDSSVGAILALAQPKADFARFLYSILFLAHELELDEDNQ